MNRKSCVLLVSDIQKPGVLVVYKVGKSGFLVLSNIGKLGVMLVFNIGKTGLLMVSNILTGMENYGKRILACQWKKRRNNIDPIEEVTLAHQ